jgi:hypothetical protein
MGGLTMRFIHYDCGLACRVVSHSLIHSRNSALETLEVVNLLSTYFIGMCTFSITKRDTS